MKMTTETIPNVHTLHLISASSTYGTGFWTGICTYFANLCGTECNRLGMKINKAKTSATNELMAKAAAASADGIMEIRYQISGKTVFIYGIAYIASAPATSTQKPVTPPASQQTTTPVAAFAGANYNTWQCKNCGTENKGFTSVCKKCGQYKAR